MNHHDRALNWAVEAGADEAEVRTAWVTGRAAEVPIGRLWHVFRVTVPIGQAMIDSLSERGTTLGPVLFCPARAAIEFLTPCGHRQVQPQPTVRLATTGHIRWPAPDVTVPTGRHAVCGRSWIVPPLITVPRHTPLPDLYRAAQASVRDHAAAAEDLMDKAVFGRAATR
ncbi:hypothetical protein [Streptomyces kronopolitis]|uniref:hypothetical protein n=1 Tax=Streptomyces kronopolitis TaxID=1612435 RepID=UPI003D999AB4